ncbi:MAG TPA: hypothetical protein VFQ40_02500 [Actinomycetota bacterium]|nr:hypothetical protein [Actinomycetota bacterium]
MKRMMLQAGGFRPRLQIVEIEGHGFCFEVYESGEYVATFDKTDGREVRYPDPPGPTIGERFGGRVAELYGFKAYEAACEKVIAADPERFDLSDVMPAPFLVIVREEVQGV